LLKPLLARSLAASPTQGFNGSCASRQFKYFGGGENLSLLIAFGPHKEAVIFTQPLGLAKVHLALMMQARDQVHVFLAQSGSSSVFAKKD